jgi:hypothetical protein
MNKEQKQLFEEQILELKTISTRLLDDSNPKYWQKESVKDYCFARNKLINVIKKLDLIKNNALHGKGEKYKHTFGCNKCNCIFERNSKTLHNSKHIKCECGSHDIKFIQSKNITGSSH